MKILSIQSNKADTVIGVMVGHSMFHDESASYFLYIYYRQNRNQWVLKKATELDIALRRVCLQFEFKNKK